MKEDNAYQSAHSKNSNKINSENTEADHWVNEQDSSQSEEFQSYISSQQNG